MAAATNTFELCLSYRFHAILSAYLSILLGISSIVLSTIAGSDETSLSEYAIGLTGFVDLTGSFLILLLYQFQYNSIKNNGNNDDQTVLSHKIRESRYTVSIGVLMSLLGLYLFVYAIIKLATRSEPSSEGSTDGSVVAVLGTIGGLIMFLYKYKLGKLWDSQIIIADSYSSLASSLSSISGLIVILLNNKYWWFDSAIGVIVALATLYFGLDITIRSCNQTSRLLRNGTDASTEAVKRLIIKRYGYQANSIDDEFHSISDSHQAVKHVYSTSNTSNSNTNIIARGIQYASSIFMGRGGNAEYDSLPISESVDDNDESSNTFFA